MAVGDVKQINDISFSVNTVPVLPETWRILNVSQTLLADLDDTTEPLLACMV